jgi:hypothetical protein
VTPKFVLARKNIPANLRYAIGPSGGVWFCRGIDIAQHWRAHFPPNT